MSVWSWRGVFLINVPIGLGVVAVAATLLPKLEPKPAARFDLAGSLLLCTCLLTAALAITHLGDAAGGPDTMFGLLALLALVAGVLLARRGDRPGAILPRSLLAGNGLAVGSDGCSD